MFRYVLNVGKKINSQAVKADAHHHRSDAIISVAAFIGITIALMKLRKFFYLFNFDL